MFGYVGPEDAFVAAPGKNRFEPGSMFRAVSGEQRVRPMFDDVCASLATLRSSEGEPRRGPLIAAARSARQLVAMIATAP